MEPRNPAEGIVGITYAAMAEISAKLPGVIPPHIFFKIPLDVYMESSKFLNQLLPMEIELKFLQKISLGLLQECCWDLIRKFQ